MQHKQEADCGMEHTADMDMDCCQKKKVDMGHTATDHIYSTVSADLFSGFMAELPVAYLPQFSAVDKPSIALSKPQLSASYSDGSPPIFVRNCLWII